MVGLLFAPIGVRLPEEGAVVGAVEEVKVGPGEGVVTVVEAVVGVCLEVITS